MKSASPVRQQQRPSGAYPPPNGGAEGRPLPPDPLQQGRLIGEELLLPRGGHGLPGLVGNLHLSASVLVLAQVYKAAALIVHVCVPIALFLGGELGRGV